MPTAERSAGRRWLPLLVIGLVAYAVLVGRCVHEHGPTPRMTLAVGALALYVVLLGALAASRLAGVRSATFVVLSGAVLQVVALTAGPRSSDDVYRYIWDGKVQFAGIDPYRYSPASPALRHLRDSLLFGPGCTHHFHGGCTVINRPTVHTVYPPVAQWGFDLVRVLSFGGHGGVRPFQVAGAVGSVLLAALLARRALRRGDPLWPVAVWAWSPIVVSEFGNNAHLDWLAALFAFGALTLSAGGRVGWASVSFACAVLTKLYPGLLLPSLVRRRPVVLVGVSVLVGLLSYLPHVIAVGGGVIGYLPGYLQEGGYSTGKRFALLSAVLPHPAEIVVAGLVLVAAAVLCAWRTNPDRPEDTAVAFAGVTFLVVTPSLGWYAAILVVLVAMSRRIEWLPVASAPTFYYLTEINAYTRDSDVYALIYLVAAVASLGLWVVRRRVSGRSMPG